MRRNGLKCRTNKNVVYPFSYTTSTWLLARLYVIAFAVNILLHIIYSCIKISKVLYWLGCILNSYQIETTLIFYNRVDYIIYYYSCQRGEPKEKKKYSPNSSFAADDMATFILLPFLLLFSFLSSYFSYAILYCTCNSNYRPNNCHPNDMLCTLPTDNSDRTVCLCASASAPAAHIIWKTKPCMRVHWYGTNFIRMFSHTIWVCVEQMNWINRCDSAINTFLYNSK